jgi:ABC-2 type transport system permease protein
MNMKTIWHVASYEFWTTMQRRSALFAMFGLPILSILIVTGLNRLAQPNTPDEDGSGGGNPASSMLSQFAFDEQDDGLTLTGVVDETGQMGEMPASLHQFFTTFPTTEAAKEAFNAETIEDYYVIPPDFLETGTVDYFAERQSLFDFKTSILYDHLVNSYITDPTLAERITRSATITETDLSATTEEISDQSMAQGFVVAIGLSIVFFTTTMGSAGYLMQSLGKEKQNRIMELLLSSIRPIELLAGKVVGLGAVGLLQVIIWGMIGTLVFSRGGNDLFSNITLPELPPSIWVAVIVFFLLGFLVYASIFAGVGAIAPSPKESGQLTFFLMLPTFIPLWFMSVILQAPNGTFATVLSLFPLTSPIAMPIRMVLVNVPILQVVLSAILVLLGAGVTLWVATRIFRSQTLLSGRGISLAMLRDAVRG